MRFIRHALAALALFAAAPALAQGPGGGGPGPGPGPGAQPWFVNGPTISYAQGSVLVGPPGSLAAMGVGTINVSGGYYLNGALIAGIVSASPPLFIAAGVISLHIDTNFAVTGGNLAFSSIAAGKLLANCTAGAAAPTNCTWTAFADQAIGSSNGMLPYRSGGSWTTISTGTSGATIPRNDTANVFSAAQAVNMSGGSPAAAQTGTGIRLSGAAATAARVQVDAYGAQAFFTSIAYGGTVGTPTALTSGTQIGGYNSYGYNGSSVVGPTGTYRCFAAETWSALPKQGTYCEVATTTSGGTTLATVMRWENDGGVTAGPSATGGSKGAGTINVSGGFYVNGAPISPATGGPLGTILQGAGATLAPVWTTATYPANVTVNRLLWASASNVVSDLATGNNGVLITSAGGVPSISSTLPAAVQANITATGTIASGTWQGSVVQPTYGGTGVNNGSFTATLGGNVSTAGAFTTAAALTQVGAFATTITVTGVTNSTLPVGTHTLAGLDVGQTWGASQNFNLGAVVSSSVGLAFGSNGGITAPSDGVWTFNNAAANGFGRIQLGGTTASFPSLKRSTTAVAFRLADDSADAGITAGTATLSGALTYGGVTLANSVTGTGSMVLASNSTIAALTVTGSFTATGLVTNADLVSPTTTVNGQACTLGAACTVTAVASAISVGVTTVTGGATLGIFYQNGASPTGTIAQYTITGSGTVVAMQASPNFLTSVTFNTTTILTFPGAATLHLGAADAASPVAQTLGVQGVVTATSNTAGANFTIAGSQGTGTGVGGSIIIQVAPAGSTGSTPNALATAVTIDSTKLVTLAGSIAGVNATFTGVVSAGAASFIGFTSRSYIDSPADGIFRFANNATSGFTGVKYGGVTASFPYLKVSGATIAFRVADDSADTTITFLTQTPGDNTTKGATTAFVTAAVAAGTAGVTSLNGATGALTLNIVPGGRLSLQINVAVMTADQSGVQNIYYVPYVTAQVPIYNGSNVVPTAFTQLTLALAGSASWAANTNYDLFVANDSGTIRLCSGPAWSGNTTRGTGAGTTELAQTQGIWNNANSMTCRYAAASTITCAVNQCSFVGSFRTTGATGATTWAARPAAASGGVLARLFLWNAYNRVTIQAYSRDSAIWNYSSATVRAADNTANNSIIWIDGLQQSEIKASYQNSAFALSAAGPSLCSVGVGLDSTSAFSGVVGSAQSQITTSPYIEVMGYDHTYPLLGMHTYQALEAAVANGCTFGNTAAGQTMGLTFTGQF